MPDPNNTAADPLSGSNDQQQPVLNRAAVLASLLILSVPQQQPLRPDHRLVLKTLRRVVPELALISREAIAEYLWALDSGRRDVLVDQLMEALQAPSDAPDSHASTAPEAATRSNALDLNLHLELPTIELSLPDLAGRTGQTVRLAPVPQERSVQDWLHAHPEGRLQVPRWLAQQLGLDPGAAPDQPDDSVLVKVEAFLERLDDVPIGNAVWQRLPVLPLASASVAVAGLWRQHQAGQLSLDEFKRRAACLTGMKLGKVALLAVVLAMPVVGPVVSAVLIARFMMSVDDEVAGGLGRQWLLNRWRQRREAEDRRG